MISVRRGDVKFIINFAPTPTLLHGTALSVEMAFSFSSIVTFVPRL